MPPIGMAGFFISQGIRVRMPPNDYLSFLLVISPCIQSLPPPNISLPLPHNIFAEFGEATHKRAKTNETIHPIK